MTEQEQINLPAPSSDFERDVFTLLSQYRAETADLRGELRHAKMDEPWSRWEETYDADGTKVKLTLSAKGPVNWLLDIGDGEQTHMFGGPPQGDMPVQAQLSRLFKEITVTQQTVDVYAKQTRRLTYSLGCLWVIVTGLAFALAVRP